MKINFPTKTLIAMAVAIAAAAAVGVNAQDQPAPPPATAALPTDIQPGTPLADVVKLLQAGVDVSTIKNFVANCNSAFNLDADKIIYLKDEGLPSDVINAMMDHDKTIYASTQTPPPAPDTTTPVPPPPADTTDTTDTAAPAAPVTVDSFTDTLSPYGSWVDVDGYGRCWRPTAVIYDSGWRPYCDRGHWVYTDTGWYWDSDYSWGITFHYGRWFRDTHLGWCWLPDTTWAPSWVAWRSSDDYCGWAPLPPFAVFTPGVGFFYRGVACSADFDFGLGADFFIFVAPEHFCDRRPRQFCAPPERVREVFQRTTIVNNWNSRDNGHGHVIVNGGIDVNRVATASHHPIEPVHVGSLPNAGHQGWRGATPANSHPGNFHGAMGNNNNPVRNSSGAVYDSHPAPNQNPVRTAGQYSAPQNQAGNNQRDRSLNSGSHPVDNSAPATRYQPPVQSHPVEPERIERSAPENDFRQTREVEPPAPTRPVQEEERNTPPPQTHVEQTHVESESHSSPPPAASHESEHSSGSEHNSDNNKQNH
ncbi:MAG TPA: DUF6600 domain-containing protein [Candidatus Sulfotelmatobacter sp.]|nr:DUF6600 domain-containing protein [Candidatus Sulfotelmatobacter sp.]